MKLVVCVVLLVALCALTQVALAQHGRGHGGRGMRPMQHMRPGQHRQQHQQQQQQQQQSTEARLAGLFEPASSVARPQGKSFTEWQVEYWKWLLSADVNRSPVDDDIGVFCSEGQDFRGNVWFLASTFGKTPLRRQCTLPKDMSIFVPLLNRAFLGLKPDPVAQKSPEFAASHLNCLFDERTTVKVEFDGMTVPDTYISRGKTFRFEYELPEENVLGWVERRIDAGYDAGYYVMLRPLPPGQHVLRVIADAPACGYQHDLTWYLTTAERQVVQALAKAAASYDEL